MLPKYHVHSFVFVSILLLSTPIYAQHNTAKQQIDDLLRGKKALVGFEACTDNGRTLQYNESLPFPLLSIFKFHVALAVLNKMDKQDIRLDSILQIAASQLLPDTYSPLRQKFPNQNFTITLKDLLKYSVSLSDNNACDILIDFVGGIKQVDTYIRQLGIHDFNLMDTEADMHTYAIAPYRNWSTPSEMVRLLKTADNRRLFREEYKDFLWEIMANTETGKNKIKGYLPKNTLVQHKTGSSDRIDGMKIADNDAGIIRLSNGRKCYIAIFIMNSYETDESNADIIASISHILFNEFHSSAKKK